MEEILYVIVYPKRAAFCRLHELEHEKADLNGALYIAALPLLPSSGGEWITDMNAINPMGERLVVYWTDRFLGGFPVVDKCLENHLTRSPFVFVDSLPRFEWKKDRLCRIQNS